MSNEEEEDRTDQRVAVGFSITLSSQLIAASMATLAVEGAYMGYALGSRLPKPGFVIFGAFAAILIIVSIIKAGKGITKARNAGFNHKWSLETGKCEFNWQAITLLLALISLGVMFCLSGNDKESAIEQRVEDIRVQLTSMHKDIETQSMLRETAMKAQETQKEKLSQEIQDLRARLLRTETKKKCGCPR